VPVIHAGAVLAVAALALAAQAEPAGQELYAEPSPVAVLVEALPGMPPVARFDLAAVILEGLIAAYEHELDQVIEEERRRAADQYNLAGWRQAMATVLGELRAWQADLYVAQQVEVRLERHNQLILRIDGRPLWIAWPRPAVRSALERELATEFCGRHECPDELFDGTAALAVTPGAAPGAWQLSQFRPPTWVSAAGVSCEFADAARLGEKERTCRDLVADLHALAAALRAAWLGGAVVEWSRLGLKAGKSGGQHQVTINARGDYITVYVPELAAQAIDWQETGRWLRGEVEGYSESATVLRAKP
jgi:hypothetical protein